MPTKLMPIKARIPKLIQTLKVKTIYKDVCTICNYKIQFKKWSISLNYSASKMSSEVRWWKMKSL